MTSFSRDYANQLIGELEKLKKIINEFKGISAKSTEKGIALFKVIPSIKKDQWDSFAKNHHLEDWLTLHLDNDPIPMLTTLEHQVQALSYRTDHDALTGAPNRRVFDRALKQEISFSKESKTPMTLAILDLDDFKNVNDTWGHNTGDEVLIKISQILIENLRRINIFARIGGEEFAIIMPSSGLKQAEQQLVKCLDLIRSEIFTNQATGEKFQVTCSAGIASYKGTIKASPELLKERADAALYEAKKNGKDQIQSSNIIDFNADTKKTLVHADEKRFLFTGS